MLLTLSRGNLLSFVRRSHWRCGFLFHSLQNNACYNFIGTKNPAASVFLVQFDFLSVKTGIYMYGLAESLGL